MSAAKAMTRLARLARPEGQVTEEKELLIIRLELWARKQQGWRAWLTGAVIGIPLGILSVWFANWIAQ